MDPVTTAKVLAVTFLTLNVAGLPDILTKQDNPHRRHLDIFQRARSYDVVLYQEDFSYSSFLEGTKKHRYRPHKVRLWGIPIAWIFDGLWFKPGLTTYSKFPLTENKFVPYSKCSGWRNKSSDCWVPKGLSVSKILLNNEIPLCVINTHMDAGNSIADTTARSHQIREYARFVNSLPSDSIIIAGGDFNSKPGEPEFGLFLQETNLTNVTGYIKGFETVDYFFVRAPDNIKIDILDSGRALEFDGLSDHPAAFISLRIHYVAENR